MINFLSRGTCSKYFRPTLRSACISRGTLTFGLRCTLFLYLVTSKTSRGVFRTMYSICLLSGTVSIQSGRVSGRLKTYPSSFPSLSGRVSSSFWTHSESSQRPSSCESFSQHLLTSRLPLPWLWPFSAAAPEPLPFAMA